MLACTLLQWSVHTYALFIQLPTQIFLPPDILQPLFPETHEPRELLEKGYYYVWRMLQLLAGLLRPCKKRQFPTGYDLGQGPATSSGPQLCCAETIDFGETGAALWVQELGTGEGECCGNREYVCTGARIRVLWGSGFPGHSGTAWFSLKKRLLSCRSPLVQRDGTAALPSALTLGRWAVLLNGAPGTLLGTVWQAVCGSSSQEVAFASLLK